VGGFRILINCLLDDDYEDINTNIFYSLLYVINSPKKRKYFNGFSDLYRIFSVFTKSDFSLDTQSTEKDIIKVANKKQLAEKKKKKIS
jgi:hypothetical protein